MLDSHFYIKTGLLWMMLLIISTSALTQQIAEKSMICDNYLEIKGESNLNRFTFNYNNSSPKQWIDNKTDADEIKISIPIREFKPSNPLMYEDFLTMLKESRYPKIIISLSRKELLKTRGSPGNCPDIQITIAGITHKYKIDCSIDECSGNLYLKGHDVLKLTDFNLTPPEKLFGMVKVHNKIDVSFGFIITFTDTNQLSSKL